MSNRSSCRILRFLGMDGFLGFKCGPSCSEKQHNKEIKALIDAIDDLLAYDSKTKKELGADFPKVAVGDDANTALLGRLDGIKGMATDLRSTHSLDPFKSSDQSGRFVCDATLRRIGATADSAGDRVFDPNRRGAISEQDRFDFDSHRRSLKSLHIFPVMWNKEL